MATKDPRYERLRIQIFCVTWLAYLGFYLTRKSFKVTKILLVDAEFGWTKADMSIADGGYLTAYALGQFLFGILGDRLGARKVVLTGMLGSIVVALLCGCFTNMAILVPLLCLQGLYQATGWAPLSQNLSQFFSQRERGRVMGLWMTNYAAGGFVAATLAGFGAYLGGWSISFWLPAVALMAIMAIFWRFQVNRPEDVGLPSIEQYHHEPEAVILPDAVQPTDAGNSWQVICEVLRSRMVWLLAAVYFLMKPARYIILFWSPLYLNEKLGAEVGESGALAGMFDLAGPISIIAGGFLSDRVFGSRRMPLCVIALFASGFLMLVLDDLPASRLMYGAALFAIGFLLYIPDSLVAGTAAIDFGTRRGAATASGLINGCGSIATILGVTLPGLVEMRFGTGSNVWSTVFVLQGICLILAALLVLPNWNALPPTAAAARRAGSKVR